MRHLQRGFSNSFIWYQDLDAPTSERLAGQVLFRLAQRRKQGRLWEIDTAGSHVVERLSPSWSGCVAQRSRMMFLAAVFLAAPLLAAAVNLGNISSLGHSGTSVAWDGTTPDLAAFRTAFAAATAASHPAPRTVRSAQSGAIFLKTDDTICPPHPLLSHNDSVSFAEWVRSSTRFGSCADKIAEHELSAAGLLVAFEPQSPASAMPLLSSLLEISVGKLLELVGCTRQLAVTEDPPLEVKVRLGGKLHSTERGGMNASDSSRSRRLQDEACSDLAISSVSEQCCTPSGASGGKGHRRVQDTGACERPPSSCTPACAAVYVPFYRNCPAVVASFSGDRSFLTLFEQCVEVSQQALLPPAPSPSHCADSETWISDIESVGCGQYAPGPTSWGDMCHAHYGQHVIQSRRRVQEADGISVSGALAAADVFFSVKVTAAEACPVACGVCPSCDDGTQNGGETGIDCGGECGPCIAIPSCPPIESLSLIEANTEVICTGQAAGDTCITRPQVGFRPSSPKAVAQHCGLDTAECEAMEQAMFAVPARSIVPGRFLCTLTGRWDGEPLHVVPIAPTVCPAKIVGQHYTGHCDNDSDTCMATCESGFPVSRGDGEFTCRSGVWVGDLVCDPISCGVTLDGASPEESAFTVCTDGDTLGSTCTASCRAGFYSTVGTGVGYFTCTDKAGGLWMQQGFSPWWESSLQCTRCPAIEHCSASSCTTGNDAYCSQCEDGFYAFRHNEEPTRCLPVSVTMFTAGFGTSADTQSGVYEFVFSGDLPAELLPGGTLTVFAGASLSLTGTGPEAVIESHLTVEGGSLTISHMTMSAASLRFATTAVGGSYHQAAGSTLTLVDVAIMETPGAGGMDGVFSMTRDSANINNIHPVARNVTSVGAPTFVVNSGPCTLSEAGRCVGMPQGYGPDEDCDITVHGAGGGTCPIYDLAANTVGGDDRITLTGYVGVAEYGYAGTQYGQTAGATAFGGSNCPFDVVPVLLPGDTLMWHSDHSAQGNPATLSASLDNHCAEKGRCGMPYSDGRPRGQYNDGADFGVPGGGWQLCFTEV